MLGSVILEQVLLNNSKSQLRLVVAGRVSSTRTGKHRELTLSNSIIILYKSYMPHANPITMIAVLAA